MTTIFYFIDTQNNQTKYTFSVDPSNNITSIYPSSINDALFSYGTYINNNLNIYYLVSGIVWIHIYSDTKNVYQSYYIPLAPKSQPQIIGNVETPPIEFPTPDNNYNSDLTEFEKSEVLDYK
jgi:hypothetical protein